MTGVPWERWSCPFCGTAFLRYRGDPAPVCAGGLDRTLKPSHHPATTMPPLWAEEETAAMPETTAPRKPFAFDERDYDPLTTYGAVHQAIGAASVCWESLAEAGVFDSTRAAEIAAELLRRLPELVGAQLGYATTGQLLDELRARVALDGGLDYTTVGGRPGLEGPR